MLTADAIVATAIPAHPIMCGIYFLIRDGRVTYVGQSVHISARIASHTLLKQFDSWTWLPCEPEALNSVERAYINALMPEENRDMMTERRRTQTPQWQIDAEEKCRAEAEKAAREAERLALEAEDDERCMEAMRAVARALG